MRSVEKVVVTMRKDARMRSFRYASKVEVEIGFDCAGGIGFDGGGPPAI